MPIRPDDFDASPSTEAAARQHRQLVDALVVRPLVPGEGLTKEEIANLQRRDRTRRYWQGGTILSVLAFAIALAAYSGTEQSLTAVQSDRDAARQELEQVKREIEPTVNITKVWTEHRIQRGALLGTTIHVKFTANNLRCEPMQVIAPFFLESGEALHTTESGYSTAAGTLAVWNDFSAQYPHETWGDVEMFLPYMVFNLPVGESDIKYNISIRRKGGDWETYATSDWQHMTYSKSTAQ